MKWLSLGIWDFPSGNRMEAFVCPGSFEAGWTLRCEWAKFPPSAADREHYVQSVTAELYVKAARQLQVQ